MTRANVYLFPSAETLQVILNDELVRLSPKLQALLEMAFEKKEEIEALEHGRIEIYRNLLNRGFTKVRWHQRDNFVRRL